MLPVREVGTPKVAFNAVALLSPLTGIGQYARSLLLEFRTNQSADCINFYSTHWSREVAEPRTSPRTSQVKAAVRRWVPNAYGVKRTLEQLRFSSGLGRERVDLYHEPNFLAFKFDGPSVITVHDLSWIRHPEAHPAERVRAMDKYFEPGLRRATRLITDSAFVKRELVDVFGIDPGIIHPVLLGVEPYFRPLTADQTQPVLAAHGLKHGAYWLAVGTLEPRKNLQLALEAFMRLPPEARRGCPMILVGMKGWNTGSLQSLLAPLIRAGEVRQLGYVLRDDLAVIIAGAKALIYPSIYEGFGLPPLEAMACGIPVIASNVSSLPEVVGEAGILVDPYDADALVEHMRRLLDDPVECARLGQLARERSGRFTWKACAEETVAVYREAIRAA